MKEKLEDEGNFVLLDVREQDEWRKSHISGAEYLGKGIIERDIETEYPNIDEEIIRTKDEVDDQFDLQIEQMEAMQQANPPSEDGGVSSGAAAEGSTKGSQTLPTPLRSGKNAD